MITSICCKHSKLLYNVVNITNLLQIIWYHKCMEYSSRASRATEVYLIRDSKFEISYQRTPSGECENSRFHQIRVENVGHTYI